MSDDDWAELLRHVAKHAVSKLGSTRDERDELASAAVAAKWGTNLRAKHAATGCTGRLKGPRTCCGWLLNALRRAATDSMRKEQSEKAKERRLGDQRAGSWDSRELGDLVAEVLDLKRAVRGLPRKWQYLLFLRYWELRTVEEAAREMGVPSSTAHRWHNRALRELRDELDA